jgi:hypothetical protein
MHKDDFKNLDNWLLELEAGGSVTAQKSKLVIDVPKGCTVWFRHELIGPLVIEYEATALSKGGPNDRVSDLNCFWMSQDDPTKVKRNGAFASYDTLKCYYVGLGGNANTTTRFRRYIGQAGNRPLLPEHDLSAPETLLRPNTKQKIRIVAQGKHIEYARDGKTLFTYDDPEPYLRGWFGFRTVASHLEIQKFRVWQG